MFLTVLSNTNLQVMAASRMKKLGLLMKDAAGYSTKDVSIVCSVLILRLSYGTKCCHPFIRVPPRHPPQDKIESIQEEQEQEEEEEEEEECEMLGFEDRYDLGMKVSSRLFDQVGYILLYCGFSFFSISVRRRNVWTHLPRNREKHQYHIRCQEDCAVQVTS